MIICGNSVPECWLRILGAMADGKNWELSPLIANFSTDSPTPSYQYDLEKDLNEYLESVEQPCVNTTASTIFPESLTGGREEVFDRFEKIWKYVKQDRRNYKGHYFRRLVAFNENNGEPINQLAHIIETYNGTDSRKPVHRRSALIALTFDPQIDHTCQLMRGFPCLQQICFIPKKNGKMALNAIYAMQHLDNRGYGNYLGLKNLGNFMASEMGLELDEINCIASILKLGNMSKLQAKKLVEKYRKYV